MKTKSNETIEEYFSQLKHFFFDWKIVLLFGVLFLLVFFFYTFHLDIIPVFADEAIYIRWAQLIKNVPTLRFVPLQDGKQPLFMWLLAFLLKFKQDPLITGRFLSVFFGLANSFVLSLLFEDLFHPSGRFSSRLFFLSFLITISLPFVFFFSRLALVDMSLSFFYSFGIYLFLLYWRYPRLDLAIITGFVFGLAWLTKSPGMVLLSIATLWLIGKTLRLKSIKILGHLLALFVTTELTYGILRLSANYHMIGMRNKDYLFPISKFLRTPWDPFFPHLKDVVQFYWFYFTPFGFILLLVGFYLFLRSRYVFKERFLIFLSFVFLPFFFTLVFARVFTARYLLYFSLPLSFLIVFSLNQIKSKGLAKLFVGGLLLWGLSYNLLLATTPTQAPLPVEEYRGYLTDWTAGWGIKESANFFANQARNNRVVVGTEGYFGTLPDGLWIYLDQQPNITIVGGPVPVKDVPQNLLASARSGNLTYLITHKSRFLIPSKVVQKKLKLIQSYPKPSDPISGTSDSLNIWQVQP